MQKYIKDKVDKANNKHKLDKEDKDDKFWNRNITNQPFSSWMKLNIWTIYKKTVKTYKAHSKQKPDVQTRERKQSRKGK